VSGTGLRILGIGSGTEIHTSFRIPGTINGAKVEVFRNTNRFVTISGLQIGGGDKLENIDGVLDGIVERYSEPSKPADSSPTTSADIDSLIKHGAPFGQRSQAFAKVVWTLAAHGHSLEAIRRTLVAYPNGIAGKYADRLGREVARCYRKWLIANVRRPAKDGEQPIWPDLKDGEPSAPTAILAKQSSPSVSPVPTTSFTTEAWSAAS
jgi:hypothetical protein